MPLIRPELRAHLNRWSEVLVGIGVILFGLWALQANDPFFQVLAGLIVVAGVGFAFLGWRRLRFRREGLAPGIVQLVEGQVSYFGPEEGGFIPLQDVVELHLAGHGDTWVLISADGARLEIPVAAQGAENLFDAFATLPGLRMQPLLDALDDPSPQEARALWLHPSRRGRYLRVR